jgi:hypothetical protein
LPRFYRDILRAIKAAARYGIHAFVMEIVYGVELTGTPARLSDAGDNGLIIFQKPPPGPR